MEWECWILSCPDPANWLSCWLKIWAKPENLASLLAPHTVKSQKSENFTFGKTVKIRLSDQEILKPFTYLISFIANMLSKLSAQVWNKIEKYILKKDIIQQIRTHILINVRQINWMKRNIKCFDDVIAFKTPMRGRFRILSFEMKTILLNI